MNQVLAQPTSIVPIADPRVLAITIQDNHEHFVNLKHQTALVYGPSPEIPNNIDYTKMRKSVYEKLKQAEAHLPKGLHFCLYEAYRSVQLQKQLFDEQYQNNQRLHPDWSSDALFQETIKLISPVINADGSVNIPPHSTGGAIDVYLIDDDGHAVDMGIHPKDWMKDEGGVRSLTASDRISAAAKKHRYIMSEVLTAVGFVNYPTEYWHWSYGDRYWAYQSKHTHAIYGRDDQPKFDH